MSHTTYRDRKRAAWLLSLLVPALSSTGPLAYLWLRDERVLWLPVLLNYVLLPSLDELMGEDLSNPPEAAVTGLEADPYYRRITHALVPVLWLGFAFSVWFFSSHDLPWYVMLAGVISLGQVCGYGINLGHELGHKKPAVERWLAKIVLSMTGYGHFHVEHNRGHHRDVATPLDPASSRMGESIYRFTLREMPGAFARAWRLERDRLARLGRGPVTLSNEVLQCGLITLGSYTLAAWLLPPVAIPFMLAAAFWGNFQLTSANYIEHYGLLRSRLAQGGYEPCRPHHSWNSNKVFSNWALFHLPRHSDHHVHPVRRYQSLRHVEAVPQLPAGYYAMFLIAYVPPLWFRLMNKRLVAAVGGDVTRINFDPGRRDFLIRTFGLGAANSAQGVQP